MMFLLVKLIELFMLGVVIFYLRLKTELTTLNMKSSKALDIDHVEG